MLQPITPFVLGVGDGEIGRRVAPWTALDGDNVQSSIRKLVRENGAGPSQPNDDCILAWELARHDRSLCEIASNRPRGPSRDGNHCDQFGWLLMPTTGKVTRWL